MYHLNHLIAADVGREHIAVRPTLQSRRRRVSLGVLRRAGLLRRVPRGAAA